MIVAKYRKGELTDEYFPRVVALAKKKTMENDDDFLTLCCGDTGTGKSMLMLHGQVMYLEDKADVRFVGFEKESFAAALKSAKDNGYPKMCCNDEANISKRDSLSKYNKHLIDLYLAIRGLNIWHWWNNPILDMLDKYFIKERINGVILITTKDKDKPRLYYYFRKKEILKIFDKYGNLDLKTLKKVRKEYAYYRGWFKDFPDCSLKKEYMEKKQARMDYKVEEFFKAYGADEKMKSSEFAEKLGMSHATVKKYFKEIKSDLDENQYTETPTGRLFLEEELLDTFRQMAERKYEIARGNLRCKNT